MATTVAVALWADSTYGEFSEDSALAYAASKRFPLQSFTVCYGAGLAQKGDETQCKRAVAHTLIIEMGYNDNCRWARDRFLWDMQKTRWFKKLAEDNALVQRVIFVLQPSYRQVRVGGCQRAFSDWERAEGH